MGAVGTGDGDSGGSDGVGEGGGAGGPLGDGGAHGGGDDGGGATLGSLHFFFLLLHLHPASSQLSLTAYAKQGYVVPVVGASVVIGGGDGGDGASGGGGEGGGTDGFACGE